MRQHIKAVFKLFLFILLLVIAVYRINDIVKLKLPLNDREPQTETYKGFYHMQPNTVDVLILGSSHSAAGFNPQDIYDYGGVCSYNLSCSAQSVCNSYFWLKEALNYQHPKVVLFDGCFLFSRFGDEGSVRRALDFMRPGPTKCEAVMANIENGILKKKDFVSCLLPFIRYHARWDGLTETDFRNNAGAVIPPQLKGFWFYNYNGGNDQFSPLTPDPNDHSMEDFVPAATEYIDKIVKLCADNDIQLILVKTPTPSFSLAQHNKMADYASKNNLLLYDFNMEDLFQKATLNYQTDMYDLSSAGAHLNTQGARKISYYMADEILKHTQVRPIKDMQWEESRAFNDGAYNDFLLHIENNLTNYISLLDDDRYTIFISVKDDAQTSMPPSARDALAKLGLSADWNDGFQKSYIAIIDSGKVIYENMSPQWLTYSGSFRNGLSRIKITSGGFQCGNDCSVTINDMEQIGNKTRGIHFVVYSNDRNCVVDSVGFDTNSPETPISR